MKITTRLILLLIGSVGIVYISLQLYSSNYYTKLVRQQVDTEAKMITGLVISNIRAIAKSTENTIRTATIGIEMFEPVAKKEIYPYLERIMKGNIEAGGFISASTLAFNPELQTFAPFVWLEDGKLHHVDIAKQYDYVKEQWFDAPFKTGKPSWSKPYFDKNAADVLMVTYSYPIITDSKVAAVLTADLYLDVLQRFLAKISKEYANEYIFILYNKDGSYVSHPDSKRLAQSALEWNKNSPNIAGLLSRMVNGEEASEEGMRGEKKLLVTYTTIPELGWSVGVVFDVEKIAQNLHNIAFRSITIIVVGLLFILIVIAIVARSITKPLRGLSDYVGSMRDDKLKGVVPYTEGRDEIAKLARNFSFMQDELQKYIASEKQSAVDAARIESEMRFAKEIQESFLPEDVSVNEDSRFDLSAYLSTARGVGGDLYDFFFLDKNHLLILLGDVADKGVPASLYMAITMAFARVLAKMFSSPAQIVTNINDNLVRYSKNNMFVTMMMIVIDLEKQEAKVVDAGHGMLYLIIDGKPVRPDLPKNVALGVQKSVEFKEATIQIKANDSLFLYTDGLTDAINCKKIPFDDKGVLEMLATLPKDASAYQNMQQIVSTLEAYIKGAARVDDIAVLLYKNKGS